MRAQSTKPYLPHHTVTFIQYLLTHRVRSRASTAH
jgi:hypothetical protein